jgi:hypothetical protein
MSRPVYVQGPPLAAANLFDQKHFQTRKVRIGKFTVDPAIIRHAADKIIVDGSDRFFLPQAFIQRRSLGLLHPRIRPHFWFGPDISVEQAAVSMNTPDMAIPIITRCFISFLLF